MPPIRADELAIARSAIGHEAIPGEVGPRVGVEVRRPEVAVPPRVTAAVRQPELVVPAAPGLAVRRLQQLPPAREPTPTRRRREPHQLVTPARRVGALTVIGDR